MHVCVPHHGGDYKKIGAIHSLTKVWSVSGSQSATRPHQVPKTLFALFTVCGTIEKLVLLLFSTSTLQAAKILVPKKKGHLNLSVWQNKLKLSTVGTCFFLGWSHSTARMGNGKLFPSCCVWRWVLKSQWIILFVLWCLLFFNRHSAFC